MRWPMISFADQAPGFGRHVTVASGRVASHGAVVSIARVNASMKSVESPVPAFLIMAMSVVPNDVVGWRECQLERATGCYRVQLREQLGAPLSDAREVVVGEDGRRRTNAVVAVVACGLLVELRGSPPKAGCPFRIQEADDQLRGIRVVGHTPSGPRGAEVAEVPAVGHHAVERSSVAQYRFYRVVREVVPREEKPLRALLPLPRDRAVRPYARECGRAVGVLLDADGQARRGHGGVVVRGSSWLAAGKLDSSRKESRLHAVRTAAVGLSISCSLIAHGAAYSVHAMNRVALLLETPAVALREHDHPADAEHCDPDHETATVD